MYWCIALLKLTEWNEMTSSNLKSANFLNNMPHYTTSSLAKLTQSYSIILSRTIVEPEDEVQYILEVDKLRYKGTFHDYAETVVQFGYVNLFSVVSRCNNK